MDVLVVEFRVLAEHETAFAGAVAENARSSVALEPGCRQFDVCRDVQDPGLFFLYELYDDAAAVEAHMRCAHFLHFNALTAPWVAGKTVRRFAREVG